VFDEMREQFQEELVPAHSRMRRYEVALGHCAGCKRRVRGRHPEQTSDALGAAGVMLGPRAHALAAWPHVGLGVPMGKVAKILAALGGIAVTPGGLHQALHRTAGDAASTYAALLASLRGSSAVAADETGWRIDGDRGWLWVYVGDTVTVYDIAGGRGYRDAAAVLGEGFAGVLERDGVGAVPQVHPRRASDMPGASAAPLQRVDRRRGRRAGQGPARAAAHPDRRAVGPRPAARRRAGRPRRRATGADRSVLRAHARPWTPTASSSRTSPGSASTC
jgi:hypothetical protein